MDKNEEKRLEEFFRRFHLMNYKKKEIIIRGDDEPTGVFYLQNGFVRMNSLTENGAELTLNIFKPGSFFPMVWAIAEVKNTYFYQAMTDVVVYRAPKKDVINMIKERPETLFDLTKRVLIGLDGLLANVQHLLFGNAHNRVASAILISARRFGSKDKDGKITVNLPLTHQDLANLAGLTRETTSIAIEELVKRSIVSQINNKFVIDDIHGLEGETFIGVNDEEIPLTL